MPEYRVQFIVVTDAPNAEEAIDDAKNLISQRRFEPTSVDLMSEMDYVSDPPGGEA